jgi:hypothetical protein
VFGCFGFGSTPAGGTVAVDVLGRFLRTTTGGDGDVGFLGGIADPIALTKMTSLFCNVFVLALSNRSQELLVLHPTS